MKVLITGYTNRMFGSTRIRRDYVTFVYLLEEILKEMGHEVHRKQIDIGEDISYVYGYAFCGLAPLNSITSGKIPETHYVADAMGSRVCWFADDWSFCGFGKSVRYSLNRWEDYLSYKNFPYKEDVLSRTRESLDLMMRIENPLNNHPVLAPMFPWGNHNFLIEENFNACLYTIDPSPWLKYPSISVPEPHEKQRKWVMAALSNHSAWVNRQRFTFPVEYVGNKNLGQQLTEDQTIQLFANSFGVLSTGYPSAGSGWWRTRYLNAVWAESPVYSDPSDSARMGEAFRGTPSEFESEYGLPEYTHRVEGQRDWLNSNLGTKEQAMETLERLMAK